MLSDRGLNQLIQDGAVFRPKSIKLDGPTALGLPDHRPFTLKKMGPVPCGELNKDPRAHLMVFIARDEQARFAHIERIIEARLLQSTKSVLDE